MGADGACGADVAVGAYGEGSAGVGALALCGGLSCWPWPLGELG